MAKKAKKRPAPKKKSSASTAKRVLASKVVRINYRCQTTCKASPKFAHMAPGDVVAMKAVNTNVSLSFVTSPFLSGATSIAIPSGSTHYEEVKPIPTFPPKHFPYTLSCSDCVSVLGPPEMIVP